MIPQVLEELTTWNTGKCNLRCEYCFVYKFYEDQPEEVMTEDTANHLLNFASRHLRRGGRIWFFGAEPFCGFDIIKYTVEKAVATPLQIQFGATTNCTLIDEEKVKFMAKHSFGVLCSLDLSKERHNKYRVYPDGRGSWDDAWRGFELVRKYVNENPQIRATFGPGSIKGIAKDIKGFVDQGLTNLAVGPVEEVVWTSKDLSELEDEFAILREYYAECFEANIPAFSMFVRDGIAPQMSNRRPWFSHCGLGQGTVGIDVNGDIYPCHRFVASRPKPIGNVRTGFSPERLHWIDKYQEIPPYCERPEECIDCIYKMACGGGCIASNYDQFGDTHILPLAYCRIKRLGVKYFGDFRERFKDNQVFQNIFLKKEQGRHCIE